MRVGGGRGGEVRGGRVLMTNPRISRGRTGMLADSGLDIERASLTPAIERDTNMRERLSFVTASSQTLERLMPPRRHVQADNVEPCRLNTSKFVFCPPPPHSRMIHWAGRIEKELEKVLQHVTGTQQMRSVS